MLTADQAGRIKCWDIERVKWRREGRDGNTKEEGLKISQNMKDLWSIQAHKSCINSITIVETFKESSDSFILSAGNDQNILLHRLTTG